jgi:nucleoside-diphosphate-sugar epimerase
MTKIYATGITGTIGKCLERDINSVNVDLTKQYTGYLAEQLDPCGAFIHLAAIVGDAAIKKDLVVAKKVNCESPIKLAEMCLSKNFKKFVFVSTSHVYANANDILSENSPINPRGIYSEQKIAVEEKLIELFRNSPEKLCIVRLFSILDWDMPDFTLGGAVRKLADKSSDFTLNNSDDIRDFLTPKTVADTLTKISICDSLAGIVNLSSATGTSIKEAIGTMFAESNLILQNFRLLPGTSNFPTIIGSNRKLLSNLPELNLKWQPSKIA